MGNIAGRRHGDIQSIPLLSIAQSIVIEKRAKDSGRLHRYSLVQISWWCGAKPFMMAESTIGEVAVERGSPATPKRSTRLVRPSTKGNETTRIDDETVTNAAKRPAKRTTRASLIETDPEYTETVKKSRPGNETGKVLLLRVLEELKDLKSASTKQQELICELRKQAADTQREIQETKEELKYVREQLETVTAATAMATQSSPRASYAAVARTPPDSQPSNIRSLSSGHTSPSALTDTLYLYHRCLQSGKCRARRHLCGHDSKDD